ncbi:MAG: hypothetical protein IT193_17715, partial [Propionibacteriaceae bacterium]|nr:hypothetical protein [Propionibacteriaceae bacterium]
MRTALASFGRETLGLAADTAGVWLRLLPRLLALTLLGWVAYHGAVLLAAEVAQLSPWLLILALSIGVVLRLATVVVALRSIATELGAPVLLRQVAAAEAVIDDRDRSVGRLLGVTLLPFLALYAAFGYVDVFARDVVLLSTYRFGPGELLTALNPLNSPVVGFTTAAVIIGLYLTRRLIDRWQDRTTLILPALVGAVVEASLLLVVLLSGFRLVESAKLWLGDRRLAQWWEQAVEAASGWLRIDLPEVVDRLWAFLAGTAWPVLWDVLSQPLAWLTLTALVFGARALTLADVWHTGRTTRIHTRLERLRGAVLRAEGPRRVVLKVQASLLGDIDDKYLPSWKSLRLVLRAGWAFLGAFVLLFNLVRFAGERASDLIVGAMGGQPVAVGIRLYPLVDLLPNVLAMSVQLALLGSGFVRMLQLQADSGSRPAVPARPWVRLAEVAVVGALVVAMTSVTLLGQLPDASARSAAVGERARFFGGEVTVDGVELGTRLEQSSLNSAEQTPLVFVVVRGRAIRPGAAAVLAAPVLVNGDRRYDPGRWGGASLSPEPGF